MLEGFVSLHPVSVLWDPTKPDLYWVTWSDGTTSQLKEVDN